MSNERILVVEDEPLVGEEIRENLERLGYSVPEVLDSGEELMRAIANGKPDLVLMDIHLRGRMDGIEAAMLAKAEAGLPVIYLSAYSDDETLARAAETSPAAYLLKPFSEKELAANVAVALSARRDRAPELLRGNLPLVEALELPALLLDDRGIVVHGNRKSLELLKLADIGSLRGEPLSRFVDLGVPLGRAAALGESERPRLLVAADSSLKTVVIRMEPLLTPLGTKEFGYIAIIDSMSGRERGFLESSAMAVNDAIVASLPEPDAAGEGWRIGGFLVPCPSGSGDIFDVFSLDRDHFCFIGIDVMGHGSLASLVAWSLRDILRGIAVERGSDIRPSELLELAGRQVESRGTLSKSHFFSAVAGIVARKTGDFAAVRAGHPPLALLRRSGGVELLESRGRAIGLLPDPGLETIGGRLEKGDRLALFSDGLMDVGPRGRGDLANVVALLSSLQGRPLPALIESARFAATERFGGDDISLLVVERRD